MNATTSPNDKYAFLFRTTNSIDLSDVKNTLNILYGYPAANIVECTGCSNLANDFKTLTDIIATHTPANSPDGSSGKNTFIVFIAGNADSSGLFDGSSQIDWDTLGYAFDVEQSPGITYYNNSEVHYYLIFPYCDNMISRLAFFGSGSINLPVCPDFTAFSGITGYIAAWKQAFDTDAASLFNSSKLLTFYATAGKIYNLGNPGSSPLSTFYRQKLNGTDDINFSASFYPGYPSLEIDDGNPVIYKTNDIWLNDLDPLDGSLTQQEKDLFDNYEAGKDNKISVRIHVRGTHPVSVFNVGVAVFRTGGGGECEMNSSAERKVSLAALLGPNNNNYNTHIYSCEIFFDPNYSHRCIKAKVSLNDITDAELDNYTDWDIITRINEAQLNIDPGGIAVSSAGQGGTGTDDVEPGQGLVDENNPGEDAEPDTSTGSGSKSLKNLRGYFEHVYYVKNRFRTTKEFRIVIPGNLKESSSGIVCRWFALDTKYPDKITEMIPVKEKNEYISFILRPGASVDLVLYMKVREPERLKVTNIPFDILIEMTPRWLTARIPLFSKAFRRFKLFSGVNVVLSNSSGDIFAKVTDGKHNPVPDAYVYIKALDGRQSAVIKTGKDGQCEIKGINTGSYKVWAHFKEIKTKPVIVNLHKSRKEKVELIFEK